MRKIKLDKRGVLTLSQVAPVVIILMTIGIVLTVGLLIMSELMDETGSTATQTLSNETHTYTAGTPFTLNFVTGSQLDRLVAIIAITNATDEGQAVPASNYTLTAGAGTILPGEDDTLWPDGWNVSYTLSETGRTIAVNGTQSSQEGLDTLATFQSIFGIIVAAAVVLGVIVLFR